MTKKSLFMLLVPRAGIKLLARATRWYTLRTPFLAGKRSILLGRSVFRLFDWYKIDGEIETRVGTRMHVVFPDMQQRSLYFLGIQEPAITAFISQSLKAGDIFIDVGANIGYYSCIAARLTGPNGQVHAIEPSPRISRVLAYNLQLNAAENVHIHRVALMDRETELTFYLGPERALGRSTVIPAIALESRNFSEEAQVPALPLHQVLEPDVLYKARLVKIDAEGAEWKVFRGFFDRLKDFEDATEWVIEITPEIVRREGGDIADIIEGFSSAGYHAYYLENPYDVDWLLGPGQEQLHAGLKELIQPLPSNLESRGQIDILFSRRRYGP